MTFSEYPDPEYIKDFSNPMTQWQRECQKKTIGLIIRDFL